MIINLSFDKKVVTELITQFPTEKVLDIAGILQFHSTDNEIVFARELDKDHSIEKKSIECYVNTIGELSNSYLRDITFDSLQLWWLTGLTEKHDSYHWGQRIFFFLELLKTIPTFFEKNLIIILPEKSTGLDEFIKDNTDKSFNFSFFNIAAKKNQKQDFLKTSLKAIVQLLIFKIKFIFSKKPKATDNHKYHFITPDTNVANNNSLKFDISWVKKLIDRNNLISINIPYPNFYKITNYDLTKNHIYNFSVHSPSIFKTILNFNKAYKLNRKINRELIPVFSNSLKFNKKLLASEFQNVILNINIFFAHTWIRNYSNNNLNSFYIYSDELYSSGRALSHSIAQKTNHSIGVQHGLITNNHTVYRITDSEISGKNTIPLPSKIIMWNKQFGKVLSKSCPLINNKLIYANDYHYSNLNEKVKNYKTNKDKKTINVLWATTLWEHFNSEFEIIKPLFKTDNIELNIRLHPGLHITVDLLNKKMNNIEYHISECSYEEDLAKADLIVTNTFSTVFYDAIKVGIPVFRIENNKSFSDFNTDSDIVMNIQNSVQFQKELNKLLPTLNKKVIKRVEKIDIQELNSTLNLPN
jgi:hypothetical protein